jgi:HNH endonuclease
MHQSLHVPKFHIEHVVPSSAGVPSTPDNLALACPSCNLHKTNRLNAVDPESGASAPLFHPRMHVWIDHFRWSGFNILGLTATARATIEALQLNHPRRLKVRMAEAMFDLFPPRLV